MMQFSSKLGNLYSKSKGYRKALLKLVLLKLLRDPEIQFEIRGKKLVAHASHNLPLYVAEFPFYDELVSRVGNFLREKDEKLIMVDVGANIGDTIVASNESSSDMFLAIEANPNFVKYLKKNCASVQNLRLIEAFLTSTEANAGKFFVVESGGTARIIPGGKNKITVRTLDSIISENVDFQKLNFLKIDTDGHDFKVVAGGKDCIAKSTPCVLFECDISGNENYLRELRDTLAFFGDSGYSLALLYDNFGYFFGAYPLGDLSNFKFPIFYQLTSNFYYFDILLMNPKLTQGFLEKELQYFSNSAPSELRKKLARDVQTFPFLA